MNVGPAICVTVATAAFFSAGTPAVPAQSGSGRGIVSEHGRLRTEKNRIVGEHGRPVSVAGVSFFWSQWMGRFYTAQTVAWLVRDWRANIVRAALGVGRRDGYLFTPETQRKHVRTVVDAAVAQDIYVIIDWHDHQAHLHADQAVAFFQEMARDYGHHPHVIYEIFNEPLRDASWPREVKPYAERVIAAIRAIDPDNLIVVGTPAWSQDVDIAAADPLDDPNVAYSLHFYAGTHKHNLRAKAEKALQLGAALFVTEWGTCNANGDGPIDEASVQEWLAFMRRHQLSHCNWAVGDKRETSCHLQPGAASTGGWKDSELTPSGRFVREIVRRWSARPVGK